MVSPSILIVEGSHGSDSPSLKANMVREVDPADKSRIELLLAGEL